MRSLIASPPFAPDRDWLPSLFASAHRCRFTTPFPEPGCSRPLIALVHHDAFENAESLTRIANDALMRTRNDAAPFPADTPRQLTAWSGAAAGEKRSLRTKNVSIKSQGLESGGFCPPTPASLPALLSRLLACVRQSRSAATTAPASTATALAFYAGFLTIHPFPDGNGRAARRLHIALLQHLDADSPHHAIALTLMHRRTYADFHAALFEARSGELHSLCEIYSRMLAVSVGQFAERIRAIDQALEEGNSTLAVQHLTAIRDCLV